MSDVPPPPEAAPAVKKFRWGNAPAANAPTAAPAGGITPGPGGATPAAGSRWSRMAAGGGLSTPTVPGMGVAATPSGLRTPLGLMTPSMTRNWDSTPAVAGLGAAATPSFGGMTPMGGIGATPMFAMGGATPMMPMGFSGVANVPSTRADLDARMRQLQDDYHRRNRHLTDEELDRLIPDSFAVHPPPASYRPMVADEPNFYDLATQQLRQEEGQAKGAQRQTFTIPESMGDGLPNITAQDAHVFEILLKYHTVDDADIPPADVAKVIVMRQLLRIKNGEHHHRRAGLRILTDRTEALGPGVIFQSIFEVWMQLSLTSAERHHIVKLLQRLVTKMATSVVPFTEKIVQFAQTLLSDVDMVMREDGRDIVALVANTVGIDEMYRAVMNDIDSDDDGVRRHTAKILAIMAHTLGPEQVMRILRPVARSQSSQARHTVVKALLEMSTVLGYGIIRVLPEVAPLFELLLRDENTKIKTDAAHSLAHVAEAIAPHGIDHLGEVLRIVRDHCRHSQGRGKQLTAFLRALGSLIPLMSASDARRNAEEIMPSLITVFNTPDDELRRVVLRVVQQCIAAEGVSADFIRLSFLAPFFEGFWSVKRAAEDGKTKALLIATTLEVAKKGGGADVLERLIPHMTAEFLPLQEMVVDTVRHVVNECGTMDLSRPLIARLVDGGLRAFCSDGTGANRCLLHSFAAIVKGAGHVIGELVRDILPHIEQRLEGRTPEVRAQAAELLALIAPTLGAGPEGRLTLQSLSRKLHARFEDAEVLPLGSSLKAVHAVAAVLGAELLDPAPPEFLRCMEFLIKNRDPVVQYQVVLILEQLAASLKAFRALETTDRRDANKMVADLSNLASTNLIPLLASSRRRTKRACARTFGVIAAATNGPLLITLNLIENFTHDNRDVRISTASALSVIARACQPFIVIPFLINEFQLCESHALCQPIRHAVLKTLRFVLEECGPAARDYIVSIVPLAERAATEESIQTRRMAIELIRVMIICVIGHTAAFGPVVTHLLNLVHPNIIELLSKKKEFGEERLKLVSSVVQVYEVARLVLGSQVIYQYLAEGLFHPARKVRDIYWRTYNIIYLANPEALIACYPATLVTVRDRRQSASDDTTGQYLPNDAAKEDMVVEAVRRHELYAIL